MPRALRNSGLEPGSIEDGPQMNEPSEQEKPEQPGKAELDERHYRASLNQLPQTRDEKAADGCDDVAC